MTQDIDATIASLRPTYLRRRQEDIPKIEQALAARDWRGAASIGHKLAGSAATYGYPELTELGRALEAACVEEQPEAAAAAYAELQTHLHALIRALAV